MNAPVSLFKFCGISEFRGGEGGQTDLSAGKSWESNADSSGEFDRKFGRETTISSSEEESARLAERTGAGTGEIG